MTLLVFSAEVFEFLSKVDLLDVESKLKAYRTFSVTASVDHMEDVEFVSEFSDLHLENLRLSGFYRNDFLTTVYFEEINLQKIMPDKTPFWIIEYNQKNYLIIATPFRDKQKRKNISIKIATLINELLFGKYEMIIKSKLVAETTIEK